MIRAVFVALAACTSVKQDVEDVGADFAEATYCELATCGQVYLCGEAELCWDGSQQELADSVGVPCEPTPRGGALGWPCIYQCPSPAHGCNAHDGCWCP